MPDLLAGAAAFVFEHIEIHSPTGVFHLDAQRHQGSQRFFLRFLTGQSYQSAAMAPGQGGHTRLQSHIEIGRSTPAGQVEDQQ
ncbi:MAG: hypothetical protein ABS57_19305 [Mesorhizobium sp. SCN 65-12]|nr:MAG: hypothetical protein ABS57_19305 [Mesorhizobium sp. SCN 65-12]